MEFSVEQRMYLIVTPLWMVLSLMTLFYATDIKHCAQYNRVYARSYIGSCIAKLRLKPTSMDAILMVPLKPAVLKTIHTAHGHLDAAGISDISTKHGFQYWTLNGMLIFAVQIGSLILPMSSPSFASSMNVHLTCIFR
jgi:hypothetical protein